MIASLLLLLGNSLLMLNDSGVYLKDIYGKNYEFHPCPSRVSGLANKKITFTQPKATSIGLNCKLRWTGFKVFLFV